MRTMQRLIDYCENTTSCSEDSQEETRVSQLHALLQHVSDVAEAFGLGISKCLKITLITKRKQQTFHAANDGNKFARLKIYLLILLDIIF